MSEEERLVIAKERIESILKSFDVMFYYDDDDGDCICINGDSSKRICIDYV